MSLTFPNLNIEQHPLRPVRLFLDTEFTQFGVPGKSQARLLSLGLVDESGERFYAECTGWDKSECSEFVREQVLPHLENRGETIVSAANRLKQYLNGYDFVVVHCDYHGDWDWLLWLLDQSNDGTTWPSALHHEPYYIDIRDWPDEARRAGNSAQKRWFDVYTQHHAFHDANGLRYVWQNACVALGGVEDPASVSASEHCYA